VSATFPLRIGQPLAELWRAPIKATIDIPGLDLSQLPRNRSSTVFQNGICRAQINASDTLQNPLVNGHAEIAHGRILGTDVETHLRFEGSNGVIESLLLGAGPNAVSFTGEIKLQDTRRFNARLFPDELIRGVSRPLVACVGGVAVIRSEAIPDNLPISEIVLNGDMPGSKWTLDLITWDLTDTAFPFCRSART